MDGANVRIIPYWDEMESSEVYPQVYFLVMHVQSETYMGKSGAFWNTMQVYPSKVYRAQSYQEAVEFAEKFGNRVDTDSQLDIRTEAQDGFELVTLVNKLEGGLYKVQGTVSGEDLFTRFLLMCITQSLRFHPRDSGCSANMWISLTASCLADARGSQTPPGLSILFKGEI